MSNRRGKRRLNGEGTVFEERDPRRRTTHRAEVEVRLPSGVVQRVIARGKGAGDARDKLHRKVRRLQDANPEADRTTIDAYFERWLEFKRATRRASTLATYKQDARHALKTLSGMKLGRITPHDVQRAILAIQEAGHAAQADRTRRTLKQAFRQAVRWELLHRSPAENIEPVAQPITTRYFLTEAQIVRLLSVTEQHYVCHPVYALGIYSGLRAGELLALQWRNVLPDGVHVERTVSAGSASGFGPPKTKAGVRTVPVSPVVLDALGPRGRDDALVFTSKSGRVLDYRRVLRDLKLAVGRANKQLSEEGALEREMLPPIAMHSLRRTYATLLAKAGVHPKVIQVLLGQATAGLAMEVYIDVMDSQIRAAQLLPVGGPVGVTRAA